MKKIVFIVLCFFVKPVLAYETTALGKIISTQGHSVPACRVVHFKENAAGIDRYFRIADVTTDDDIGAIILSALIANRDIRITYDVSQTTGCGAEPKITYVTIY